MMKRKIISAIILLFFLTAIIAPSAMAKGNSDDDETYQRYYRVIYGYILRTSPSLGVEWADWTTRAILAFSSKWGVHPFLAAANFAIESGFNMSAYSRTGAIGIAQLQPETAANLGVDPYDPAQNVEGGIRYIAEQLYTFRNSGDWTASYAIAAYNAGPGAIKKYGGIPPYDETINHVIRVGAIYRQLLNDFAEG